MKYIISGTNRRDSRSFEVSQLVQKMYASQGEKIEIIDLKDVGMNEVDETHYSEAKPKKLAETLAKIQSSDGLIFVVPEYNGSMPGILKYFIDHWKYPESFEFRPVAFIGLGGMFGALRAVEQLQMVLGYRNAFMYPERIFLTNVWNILKEGQITDSVAAGLLEKQITGFRKFTVALQTAGLDANSIKR
jgi:chromate reductase